MYFQRNSRSLVGSRSTRSLSNLDEGILSVLMNRFVFLIIVIRLQNVPSPPQNCTEHDIMDWKSFHAVVKRSGCHNDPDMVEGIMGMKVFD